MKKRLKADKTEIKDLKALYETLLPIVICANDLAFISGLRVVC